MFLDFKSFANGRYIPFRKDRMRFDSSVELASNSHHGSVEILISQCSSGVEQLFCKQPVIGSNPVTGSLDSVIQKALGGYQSGQLGQTVNLLS